MQQRKKILVVDDDPDIVLFLQEMLEEEGYTIVTARNGEEVQQLASDQPDLILLDMLISGSDGRELARLLKSRAETSNIPILMFSAHPGAEEATYACGADDFLAKPFEVDELIAKVEQSL